MKEILAILDDINGGKKYVKKLLIEVNKLALTENYPVLLNFIGFTKYRKFNSHSANFRSGNKYLP